VAVTPPGDVQTPRPSQPPVRFDVGRTSARNRAWILLAVVGLGLGVTGFGQVALAASIVFAASLVRAESGMLVRAALGAGAVGAWYLSVGVACDLFELAVQPALLAVSGLVVFGLLALIAGDRRRSSRRSGDLLIAVATCLLIAALAPQMIGSGTDIVSRLAPGYDNTNHFRLLVAVGEARGFFWSRNGVDGVFSEAVRYSQGEAFLSAYLSWILRGGYGTPTTSQFLHFVGVLYPLKIVATSMVAVLVTRELVWDRFKLSFARRGRLVSAVAVLLLTAGGITTITIQLGFQTQALANLAVLLGLLALLQRERHNGASAVLLLASGSVVLASHSWPFAVPALAVPMVIVLLRAAMSVRWWAWAAMVAMAFVSVLGYTGLSSAVRAGALLTATSGGTVYRIPAVAWISLGIVSLVTVVWLYRLQESVAPPYIILWAMLGGLITSAAIGAIQWTAQGLSYYFYKSAYLVVLLAAILAGAFAGLVAGRPLRPGPLTRTAAVCVVLLAWLPLAPLAFLHFTLTEPPRVSRSAVAEALHGQAIHGSARQDIVVMHPCRSRDVDYSSRWIGTLLKSWTHPREVFVSREEQLRPSPTYGERFDMLREYAATREGVTVYVARGCPLLRTIMDAQVPRLVVRADSA